MPVTYARVPEKLMFTFAGRTMLAACALAPAREDNSKTEGIRILARDPITRSSGEKSWMPTQ
jgi:hypothetical protein